MSEVAHDLEALEQIEREADANGADNEIVSNEPEIPTSELIYPIVSMATAVVAPNWEIKEEENKALAEAYGDLLDKYFPNVGQSFGVELNALLITAAIFAPRIGKPLKQEKKEKVKAEKVSNKQTSNNDLSVLDVQETIDGEPI